MRGNGACWLVWLPLLWLGCGEKASPPAKAPDLLGAQAWLEQQRQAAGIPGLAVMASEGAASATLGLGHTAEAAGEPVTGATAFPLGSVGELLTALATVELAGEGRLVLEDPIATWVPGLAPAIGNLTPHQLLSQTSGLVDRPAGPDPATLLRSLAEADCHATPGRLFSRSRLGSALVTEVVAHATGSRFEAALARHVLEPLALEDTSLRADGEVWSTARDLARLGQALAQGGRVEGRQALRAASVAAVGTSWIVVPAQPGRPDYGFGTFVAERGGTQVLWQEGVLGREQGPGHGGATPGFSAFLLVVPERGQALALLANRAVRLEPLAVELAERLFALPRAPAPTPSSRPGLASESAELVGSYQGPFPLAIELLGEAALELRHAGRSLPLRLLGEDCYLAGASAEATPERLCIVRDLKGEVAGVQFSFWYFRRV
jgi:CubicO group peptidase (beta-lactamase class C family)